MNTRSKSNLLLLAMLILITANVIFVALGLMFTSVALVFIGFVLAIINVLLLPLIEKKINKIIGENKCQSQ